MILSSSPVVKIYWIFISCILSVVLFTNRAATQQNTPTQNTCTRQQIISVLNATSSEDEQAVVTCNLRLSNEKKVTKHIVLAGDKASGTNIDCNNGVLDSSWAKERKKRTPIIIKSVLLPNGDWSIPSNITIKNCTIKGTVIIYGLGLTASDPAVRASSFNKNHTSYTQSVAPKGITFTNNLFISNGSGAIYAGPGVTNITIEDSTFEGKTSGTVIYLEAETANNKIINNEFKTASQKRELIAIDGSARNTVSRNTFYYPNRGAISLYRNCGEGGTIRHQTPQFNTIAYNTFIYAKKSTPKPAIWLNSRGGKQSYCFLDSDYPYGSSSNPLDFAENNSVYENRFINNRTNFIRGLDRTNTTYNNYSR